jgi:mRNA degradation ribonuclease J1/J2
LLIEVSGLGGFEEVGKLSNVAELNGCEVNILSLDGLIKAKHAAGRPKFLVIPELEALVEAIAETAE